MREIPECMSRRYKALDDLIQELNSYQPTNSNTDCVPTDDDPGIKLMCDFWDILKEDPDINLTQAVQQRMRIKGVNDSFFQPNQFSCYMAGCCNNEDRKRDALKKIKQIGDENSEDKSKGCSSKSGTPSMASENLPLNKVLCNLKDAASFEKKCHAKINDLLEAQKQLQEQIQVLEQREKDGIQLLKQADCMWSCMEETYKKKIAASLEKQKGLLKQLKDVEASNIKWRKNKKELEFQMNNVNKCHQEIIEKINEKTSDIKCIDLDVDNFKKRIESNKKDLEVAKKSLGTKKQTSDEKIAKIAAKVTTLEKSLREEQNRKIAKEQEGTKYIKEAREDLQKLCKVLLQKRLQNEDMRAEKEALLLEIELLNQTSDQCKDKCKNKQESMIDEIKKIDQEISDFKVKCIRCHECTDTADIRKFCTDCPKCLDERNCLYEGDHCSHDHTTDCVCMTIKQKFLDNVFDNMYTVLERQVQSGPGKAVAQEVLNCLKNSRNGKLNDGTRKILQDFILTTVKRNLNLTIVGGAVKTRCEMDTETYKQLMLCLKQVKVTKPTKADKGTDSKKDPCRRWGGSSECNCPKGPKACICTRKAPPPPGDPTPCPPQPIDKEDAGQVITCPHKESTPCGPDCGMHAVPSAVGSEVASWRPSPCQGPTCQFKNMRAAQCVLGPEVLSSLTGPLTHISPTSTLEDKIACRCGAMPTVPCVCHKDVRGRPRERIIEEVMGRYTEVTPIEKDTNIVSHVSAREKQVKKIPNRDSKTDNECRLLYMKPIKTHNKSIESPSSFLSYDSKQLKTEISCNIDTCTTAWESIEDKNVHRPVSNTHVKLNVDDIPVKETYQNLAKGQLQLTVRSGQNELSDASPIISKTSSGDLKMALDKNIINLIDKKIQDVPNLYIGLKRTCSGELSVDLHTEDTKSHFNKKVLAKKSPSGNIILEIHKKSSKKCIANLEKLTNKLKIDRSKKTNSEENLRQPCGQSCSKNKGLTCESLTKFILDTNNKIRSKCKGKSKYETVNTVNQLFKIKVKGINNSANEILFAIKPTVSGVYEIILDKEFEKLYKKTIKEYKGEDENHFIRLVKSDSGHFIMNFDNNDQKISESRNALLVKSESGNIKVIVSDNNLEIESIKKNSKSVISPKAVHHLLTHLSHSNKDFNRDHLKRSQLISTKSNSDSNLYGKIKFNLQNNQNIIESEAVLNKSSSGEYTVVLGKESKKTFINNLKNYLHNSSKGNIPINRTKSGNILINLKGDHKSHYASLKITPSGNMFIVLDKNSVKGMSTNTPKFHSDKNIHKESKVRQNKTFNSKATTTTSNARCSESSCDERKCFCDIKCYKSKKWFLENPKSLSPPKICGANTVVNEKSNHNFNSKEKLEIKENSPHIVIKPCGCRPVLEKSSIDNCYNVVQSICPYHIDRYQTVSNEILEISGLCKRTNMGEKKIEKPIENAAPINNNQIEVNWDSLKFLPPQLPPFLRDFSFV